MSGIGIKPMFVDRLKHSLDIGILVFVKFAYFASVSPLAEGGKLVLRDKFGLQRVGVHDGWGDGHGRDFEVVREAGRRNRGCYKRCHLRSPLGASRNRVGCWCEVMEGLSSFSLVGFADCEEMIGYAELRPILF